MDQSEENLLGSVQGSRFYFNFDMDFTEFAPKTIPTNFKVKMEEKLSFNVRVPDNCALRVPFIELLKIVELKKTHTEAQIQVVTSPIKIQFDDSSNSWASISAIRFRSRSLCSDCDVPWRIEYEEYAWLTEVVVGECLAQMNVADLVSISFFPARTRKRKFLSDLKSTLDFRRLSMLEMRLRGALQMDKWDFCNGMTKRHEDFHSFGHQQIEGLEVLPNSFSAFVPFVSFDDKDVPLEMFARSLIFPQITCVLLTETDFDCPFEDEPLPVRSLSFTRNGFESSNVGDWVGHTRMDDGIVCSMGGQEMGRVNLHNKHLALETLFSNWQPLICSQIQRID
uniref:Fmp27_GFWDK domain-containing protein n=1 Tax=Globodera pallida TaxID=36090 RepID=A0A183CP61_GLOPA